VQILLDNCVHGRFGTFLEGHEVVHCSQVGWGALQNGKLLQAAHAEGYDVLITVDQGIRSQQDARNLPLHLLTLQTRDIRLPSLAELVPFILEVLAHLEKENETGRSIVIAPPGRDSGE